jgi:hypothetical protein
LSGFKNIHLGVSIQNEKCLELLQEYSLLSSVAHRGVYKDNLQQWGEKVFVQYALFFGRHEEKTENMICD